MRTQNRRVSEVKNNSMSLAIKIIGGAIASYPFLQIIMKVGA